MQIDTLMITDWSPAIAKGSILRAPEDRPETPWKQLKVADARRTTGFNKPTYQRHITEEMLNEHGLEYWGKPYNFNTKYVVDCEADEVIGSHITLASGKKVWIDMSAEMVHTACNRR